MTLLAPLFLVALNFRLLNMVFKVLKSRDLCLSDIRHVTRPTFIEYYLHLLGFVRSFFRTCKSTLRPQVKGKKGGIIILINSPALDRLSLGRPGQGTSCTGHLGLRKH